MITIRCKECRKELTSTNKVQFCGCPNQMSIVDNKIGAKDLDKVVMVNSQKSNSKNSVLTSEDVAWHEQRRKRKVRKLNFEIK